MSCCGKSEKKCPLISATFVGLAGAGKTTLLQRLQDYVQETVPTIGSDNCIAHIDVPNDGKLLAEKPGKTAKSATVHLKLFAFDTAGQEEERERWCHHFKDVDAVVFVVDGNEFYDIKDQQSFDTDDNQNNKENENSQNETPRINYNEPVVKDVSKALYMIAKDPNLATTPVLIVINKIDLVNARDKEVADFTDPLNIDLLEKQYGFGKESKHTRFTILSCSAIDGTGTNDIKVWLYNQAILNKINSATIGK